MAAFTITRHIEAPRETVFDYAADLRNAPQHISGIKALEILTEGPVGVGTRFKETRVLFKREATEEMEVTAFDRPQGYTVECENHGCHYRTDVRLTPSGNGTDMEMRFEARPLGVMAKVMSVVFAPMMKSCAKAMANDLDDLKGAIESEVGTAAAAQSQPA